MGRVEPLVLLLEEFHDKVDDEAAIRRNSVDGMEGMRLNIGQAGRPVDKAKRRSIRFRVAGQKGGVGMIAPGTALGGGIAGFYNVVLQAGTGGNAPAADSGETQRS